MREVQIERDRTFVDWILKRKARIEIYESPNFNEPSVWRDKKTKHIISANKALEVNSIYYHTNREGWGGDNP
jgi:hypothetical protein